MGASLGHLVIYIFNISKNEMTGMSTSIDYETSHPIEKAEIYANPVKIFQEFPHWTKNDIIIYVISIPLVLQPTCIYVKYDDITKLVHNENHKCCATVMQNQERFFRDESYNPSIEPYITNITVDNIVYSTKSFISLPNTINQTQLT